MPARQGSGEIGHAWGGRLDVLPHLLTLPEERGSGRVEGGSHGWAQPAFRHGAGAGQAGSGPCPWMGS